MMTSSLFPSDGTVYNIQSVRQPWSCQAALGKWHRFELRPGDQWVNDIGLPKERTELELTTKWPYGSDVWVSYWIRISDGPAPSSWCLFSQFFSAPDPDDIGRSPIMSILFQGGVFQVETRSDPNATSTSYPNAVVRYEDPSYPRGVWQRFVIRLRPERAGNGRLDVWRNGSLIYGADIPVGYNDATAGPYFKHGIYRYPDTQTMVAEFANMEIGATDLSDRISSPIPLPAERA